MTTKKTNSEPLPVENKELTNEEYAIMRKETIDFYNEQLEVLKPQAEYESLLASIEESRLRRTNAIMRHAQLKMGPTPEDTKDPKRKLKQD